jgi:2-amino-4-hydroxy-6-hydroxymethyldihydropteridine diphosphokinase
MHNVFLGVGGNIGNKQLNIEKVKILITKEIGEIEVQSSVYETPPWGFLAKEDFWNQVLLVKTLLEPEELIGKVQSIENLFGKTRDAGYYVSREMDIDVLYFDDLSITSNELIIPHPRIAERLFVLVPLTEIAPGFMHPVLKLTNRQLLDNCSDDSSITRIEL